ncbi:MAG: recombination protein RecR [Erysipelotrichaceae bacterium]|nr:recombination protein RecR [Erysipelotrichaceae bacterium]MBP1530037.1 recombination protein RecR [Erysipelotrichaceae bacterium]MBQ3961932.1 recombination protein RecR [Erysipelotrichaceae bacterium]
MYPKRFEQLVAAFEKLPGVGGKTAQRYAFTMLEKDSEQIDEMVEALKGMRQIKRCRICGFLSDEDECIFCKDKTRSRSTLMVVAYPQDVAAIEKTGSYKGMYHVLGGLISSSKGIYPEDINIEKLLNRIDDSIKEVIVATSPTMDGEMTALYLDKVLKEKGVLVTRLAHGLPMGASLDYADDLTLIKALDNRRKIENE